MIKFHKSQTESKQTTALIDISCFSWFENMEKGIEGKLHLKKLTQHKERQVLVVHFRQVAQVPSC